MISADVTGILDEFEQCALSLYTSRRYELGGINYGKDAMLAIAFVRRSLPIDQIENASALLEALGKLKKDYAMQNQDIEGVGCGIIEDLIRRLGSAN